MIRPKLPLSVITIVLISFFSGLLGSVVGNNIEGFSVNQNPGVSKKVVVQEESAVIDVVKKVTPAVVSITSNQSGLDFFGNLSEQQTGAATGFVIRSDGLILTNNHVVSDQGAKYSVFTGDGKEYKDAQVVARDVSNDVAFLRINAKNLPVVEVGDSASVQIGQMVIAIGNALGQFDNTVTTGVISGKGRPLTAGNSLGGAETLENLLQTDAAINPGNSGGPLVNIDGQVIGINTAVAQAENIGFAIPIDSVKKQISQVETKGRIEKPVLGVRFVTITKDFAARNNLTITEGALVYGGQDLAVIPGSPADKAGVQEGDIITKINDIKLDKSRSLGGVIASLDKGDKVRLFILRDGKEVKLDATLE